MTEIIMNEMTLTVETVPDIAIEFVVMGDEELEKPFRVIIHNDDITPIDFVIAVLCTIFEPNSQKAIKITCKAHRVGKALATVLSYREGRRRVYNAQTAASVIGCFS